MVYTITSDDITVVKKVEHRHIGIKTDNHVAALTITPTCEHFAILSTNSSVFEQDTSYPRSRKDLPQGFDQAFLDITGTQW